MTNRYMTVDDLLATLSEMTVDQRAVALQNILPLPWTAQMLAAAKGDTSWIGLQTGDLERKITGYLASVPLHSTVSLTELCEVVGGVVPTTDGQKLAVILGRAGWARTKRHGRSVWVRRS